MPDSEGFPRTLPSWGPRVTENLRCSQGLQVAEMWTRRSCALQSPYYFCHLSPQWLQLLNIHEVKWSSSRAQGLLGYLLLGCTHWKKSNKSGIIHILKHMGPKTWLKRQSGPEPLQPQWETLNSPSKWAGEKKMMLHWKDLVCVLLIFKVLDFGNQCVLSLQVMVVVVQSPSCVQPFATPWTAASQDSVRRSHC